MTLLAIVHVDQHNTLDQFQGQKQRDRDGLWPSLAMHGHHALRQNGSSNGSFRGSSSM